MPELKDWLNSINKTKVDLLADDDAGLDETTYTPFIVNRCLSYHPELIYLVNEMNKNPDADKKFQYHFLLHTVSQKSRFSPWQKQDKLSDLDTIKQYFNYNNQRAREALRVLTPEQVAYIRMRLDHGTKMSVEKVKSSMKRGKKK